MTDFQPTDPTEAHPARDEYVIERALGGGDWVVESTSPAPTQAEAEAQAARLARKRPDDTFRTVRRTIASTVIAVRPGRAT